MEDISNKTIIMLLALALMVTVASTFFTIQKINSLDQTFNVITGAPSFSFGETNITVSSVTALTLGGANGTLINFGTGYVNASCDACFIDSNNISSNAFANGSFTNNTEKAVCCTTFSQPTSGFLLENTGNTNLSVGYTCSGNCTFAAFSGGTRLAGYGGLEIKVGPNSVALQTGEQGVTDSSLSCRGGGTLYRDQGWNITNLTSYTVAGPTAGIGGDIYTSLSSIGHYLCGNATNFPLMSDNVQDAGVVDINLTILSDAPALGIRSSFRLTFNASSS